MDTLKLFIGKDCGSVVLDYILNLDMYFEKLNIYTNCTIQDTTHGLARMFAIEHGGKIRMVPGENGSQLSFDYYDESYGGWSNKSRSDILQMIVDFRKNQIVSYYNELLFVMGRETTYANKSLLLWYKSHLSAIRSMYLGSGKKVLNVILLSGSCTFP